MPNASEIVRKDGNAEINTLPKGCGYTIKQAILMLGLYMLYQGACIRYWRGKYGDALDEAHNVDDYMTAIGEDG